MQSTLHREVRSASASADLGDLPPTGEELTDTLDECDGDTRKGSVPLLVMSWRPPIFGDAAGEPLLGTSESDGRKHDCSRDCSGDADPLSEAVAAATLPVAPAFARGGIGHAGTTGGISPGDGCSIDGTAKVVATPVKTVGGGNIDDDGTPDIGADGVWLVPGIAKAGCSGTGGMICRSLIDDMPPISPLLANGAWCGSDRPSSAAGSLGRPPAVASSFNGRLQLLKPSCMLIVMSSEISRSAGCSASVKASKTSSAKIRSTSSGSLSALSNRGTPDMATMWRKGPQQPGGAAHKNFTRNSISQSRANTSPSRSLKTVPQRPCRPLYFVQGQLLHAHNHPKDPC